LVDKLNSLWAGKPFNPDSPFVYDNFRVQSAQGTRSSYFTVDVVVTFHGGDTSFQQTLRFTVTKVFDTYYVGIVTPNGILTDDQKLLEKSIGFLPVDFGPAAAPSQALTSARQAADFNKNAGATAAGRTLMDTLNTTWAGKQLQGQTIDGFQFQSASGTESTGFQVTLDMSLNGGKDHQTLTFKLSPSDQKDVYFTSDPTQSATGFQFSGESLAMLHAGIPILPVLS
jgi:hypothetical protein